MIATAALDEVPSLKNEVPSLKKEQRAERFSAILKRHSIPTHGAATQIAKEIGVSDATVSAWMRGSMPRDPDVFFAFCDRFDIDPYWWTNGQARPRDSLDSEKLVRAFLLVENWAIKNQITVTVEQKALLVAKCYDDPSGADVYLESMAPFFKNKVM